jgi:hypothetical protein
MTITSQQYAYLADHSYGRDEHGNAVDLGAMVGKSTVIGGDEYRVLAYADKPSGYQGAVYQRVDSGEIVVAHRGTEFERQKWADLVKTDGLMAFSRFNPQADDAIALTNEALKIAEVERSKGIDVPSVTHTGHSLGGTLAQVSGHYFGQRGETFNAYGAASLNIHNPATGEFYRMPGGGDAFVNHVMGADMVSAASPQYGQVRTYTNPREIDTLERWGYANNRSQFDFRSDIDAAIGALRGGSHDMHNFLPWNGDFQRDASLLNCQAPQQLAAQYDPMLDKYRSDVHTMRAGIGLLGTNLQDVVETFQKPLQAGEPARRAAQHHGRRGASLDLEPTPTVPDMRDPAHPANGKYRQAYAGMHEIDRAMGRASDDTTERVAAALAAQSTGLREITRVELNRDGSRVAALDTSAGPPEARQRVDIDIASAVRRPVEASTREWQAATQQLALEQSRQQTLERERMQGGPALA